MPRLTEAESLENIWVELKGIRLALERDRPDLVKCVTCGSHVLDTRYCSNCGSNRQ